MKNSGRKYIPLGEFSLIGDTLCVTDPFYSKERYYSKEISAGFIEDMKPGEYNAYVKYKEDGRVEMLLVAHSTFANACQMADNITVYYDDKIEHPYWKLSPAKIEVASGQCGLFDCDNAVYADYSTLMLSSKSSKQAGVVPCGAVSSCGCVDSVCLAFVLRNSKNIGMAECIIYA